MKLIVGLGNPGQQYDQTRHNIGFDALRLFAQENKIDFAKKKFESLLAEGQIGDRRVLLALPQTYMNLSGRAVASLLNYFKIPPSELVVLQDEMDLPLGTLRVVRGGGAAGHRGILSIQECLGTKEFCRFRIGIGKPALKQQTSDFVLAKFSSDEKKQVEAILEKVVRGLALLIHEGLESTIPFCNSKI